LKISATGRLYLIELPVFLHLFIDSFTVSSISPILIEMSASLSSSPDSVILVISFLMMGAILGIIISPLLAIKFRRPYIFLVSYSIFLPLLVILTFSESITVFYIIYFFIGTFLGSLWVQANTSMLESKIENKDNVITFGYITQGLGAVLAPVISSSLVKYGANWRYLYIVLIIIILSNIMLFVFLRKDMDTSHPFERLIPLKSLFKNKRTNIYLLLTLFAAFLSVLCSSIIISWGPTFFRIYRSFDVQSAGLILTFYWIGIILGRFFISLIISKIKIGYLLILLSTLSILSLIFVTISKTEIISFIAIFFVGLGFSGIIPLLVSSTTTVFIKGKEVVISILFILPTLSFFLAPFISTAISRVNMFLSFASTIFFMAVTMIVIISRTLYKKI
jgi:MFS family permease